MATMIVISETQVTAFSESKREKQATLQKPLLSKYHVVNARPMPITILLTSNRSSLRARLAPSHPPIEAETSIGIASYGVHVARDHKHDNSDAD